MKPLGRVAVISQLPIFNLLLKKMLQKNNHQSLISITVHEYSNHELIVYTKLFLS